MTLEKRKESQERFKEQKGTNKTITGTLTAQTGKTHRLRGKYNTDNSYKGTDVFFLSKNPNSTMFSFA